MGDEFDDDDIYSGLKQVTAKLYTTNTPGTKSKSNFDATPGNNDHQQQQQTDSIQNPTKDTSQTINTGQPAQHTEEYVATICRAWKLGKCDRGDGCRYNHDQAYHNTEKWQPPNAKAKIFIGGIPFEAEDADVRLTFEKYGDILDISIVKDKMTGKSRGFGFVTYVDENSITSCLQGDNAVLGRQVDLRRAVPRGQEAPQNQERKTFKTCGDSMHSSNPGMIGEKKQDSDDDWRKKVFVGGVPQEVDNAMMNDYFSKYCEHPDARLMYDRGTGRSRGFGFVVFPSSEVVEQVLTERHELGGRQVEIKRAVPRGQMNSQQPNRNRQQKPQNGYQQQRGNGAYGGGRDHHQNQSRGSTYGNAYGGAKGGSNGGSSWDSGGRTSGGGGGGSGGGGGGGGSGGGGGGFNRNNGRGGGWNNNGQQQQQHRPHQQQQHYQQQQQQQNYGQRYGQHYGGGGNNGNGGGNGGNNGNGGNGGGNSGNGNGGGRGGWNNGNNQQQQQQQQPRQNPYPQQQQNQQQNHNQNRGRGGGWNDGGATSRGGQDGPSNAPQHDRAPRGSRDEPNGNDNQRGNEQVDRRRDRSRSRSRE